METTSENVALDEGETITLSLEDAQIILQEQGIDGAVNIPPGTYHILTQEGVQITENGIALTEGQSNESVGITVLHTDETDLGDYSTENVVTESVTVDGNIFGEGSENQLIVEQQQNKEEYSEQGNNEGITMSMSVDDADIETAKELLTEENNQTQITTFDSVQTEDPESGQILSSENQGEFDGNPTESVDESKSEENVPDSDDSKAYMVQEADKEGAVEEKKLDLSKPIEVTNQTVVIINKKKCILMPNPDTGQLCAYPVLPPGDGKMKRKRGRPRKDLSAENQQTTQSTPQKTLTTQNSSEQNTPVSQSNSLDQTNSAAEGLLELSNTGQDGVRRSNRKRQKARLLDDYEVLEVSSDSGGEDDDDDGDVTATGAIRKRRKLDLNDYTPFSPYILPGTGVKKGRGRPRRYPPPGQSNVTQIPAVVIPSANGQTIMMAPIQGLQNFQVFQEQVKSLPTATMITNNKSQDSLVSNGQVVAVSSADGLTTDITTVAGEELAIDANQNSTDDGDGELEQAAASAENIMSNTSLSDLKADGEISDETQKSINGSTAGEGDQQTIIQIPENLLPMFLPKKDPVKIGLKASENELEKLKCPKCDYQAYYPQQYQAHIASHTEDVQKCKCCNFYTFDKEDLLTHFKINHPRCICNVCNFCAEHAYVIKRHMMRHKDNGCTCELCGKVYKDQYILKMHVKMVHMPAEILFECTICLKKFTRKAHLKRHLRIHEPEKPFKCPHCDYRGCERSDISKHLLIHEEPKHVCDVCGKAFRHLKNKELHLKRHSGQRDYKCGVCDFYGYTFTDIRKHIERKHADIKTLVCDKCGSAFKSEILLREHQKQQCEVFMIEQALAIATSTGGMSQATLQIPSTSLTVDGQMITIDSQQFAMDSGQVNITVEQVSLPEDDSITLTEEQLQASLQDGSIAVTQAHVIETDSVEEMTAIQEEVEEDGQIITEEDVELSATEEELSIAMV